MKDVAFEKPKIDFQLSEIEPLRDVETRYIETVLQVLGDNKTRAAKLLGVSRKTIYRRLGLLKD